MTVSSYSNFIGETFYSLQARLLNKNVPWNFRLRKHVNLERMWKFLLISNFMKEGNVYYDVLIYNLKMSESREKLNFSVSLNVIKTFIPPSIFNQIRFQINPNSLNLFFGMFLPCNSNLNSISFIKKFI